ncbi:Endonuclease, Uma2 family [Nostoc flagelliforme CCNUN1]|uniref:Endonuclease, Uma2 family n=1 Tax=Nostoc flagelliforme CCNUN1 TaxID=2038116 RepID=A0A2K8STT9_9NOSO|nr:hypothetical protein [Nostoc flagelliforme]AUB38879.1 Endonuclease, Uma2 family [Nostoc flagelliforme CCNUN1]
MGIPEIWCYDGTIFNINILRDDKYIAVDQSLAFPNLPITEITDFLQQVEEKDYLELVNDFRNWVRSKID